ncbi:MAG: BON domain-containing protein [Alphaproteobacteria bacterium]
MTISGCTGPELLLTGGATAATAVAQERGPGEAVSDNVIAARINDHWLEYDWHIFRDVSTSVSEGRVMLTGKVAKPEDKLAAVRLTSEVGGVREVLDDIEVSKGGDTISPARDLWISTQLRSSLTFDGQIRAINYNVVTVDGVVHILGIAQNQDEIDRVMQYAKDLNYVHGVVNHVLLKDDPRRFGEPQNTAEDDKPGTESSAQTGAATIETPTSATPTSATPANATPARAAIPAPVQSEPLKDGQ